MNKLKVFVDEKGRFGNPVGVVEDIYGVIESGKRQAMAKDSGLSEIVFIDNVENQIISIYSPTRQIPFAGHAAVGTAYYLRSKLNNPIKQLVSMGEVIKVWEESNQTWVKTATEKLPKWNMLHIETVEELEAIDNRQAIQNHAFLWTWMDENKGLVRARTLAPDWGITEDEANGSGSMLLSVKLGKELIIHHGKGSVIYARPNKTGIGEVGGRVVYE